MMAVMVSIVTSASAMSYKKARKQALFLTDKMAYELQLNEEQYEAAYEINLDYLMAVSNTNDVFGTYWIRRNTDFRYVLAHWQYDLYTATDYFYRPLYWQKNVWHFTVYNRYSNRNHFYRPRPRVYVTYRGGYHNGDHKYYSKRKWNQPKKRVERVIRTERKDNRTFGPVNQKKVNSNRTFGSMKRKQANKNVYAPNNNKIQKTGTNNPKNVKLNQRNRTNTKQTTGNRNFGSNKQSQPSRSFGSPSSNTRAGKSTNKQSSNTFGGHR